MSATASTKYIEPSKVRSDAEPAAGSIFAPLGASHQMAVSGKHWIDIMAPGANKGRAVQQLQQALGVTAAQTAVFGDYLNDPEMLDHADLSFAMGNAHPLVLPVPVTSHQQTKNTGVTALSYNQAGPAQGCFGQSADPFP